MAWEKEKHVVLANEEIDLGKSKIRVECYSYDQGEPKIAIRSVFMKNGGWQIGNVGGMDLATAKKVAIRIKKVVEKVQEAQKAKTKKRG